MARVLFMFDDDHEYDGTSLSREQVDMFTRCSSCGAELDVNRSCPLSCGDDDDDDEMLRGR